MKASIYRFFVIFILCLVYAIPAFAEEQKKTKFGVGFQSTFPALGISGVYDINDKVSAQGVLGLDGELKMYAVRGIYKLRKEPGWNTYGYGMIGSISAPVLKVEGQNLDPFNFNPGKLRTN